MKYRRILLKISGEAFMGAQGFGVDHEASLKVAKMIQSLQQQGCQIGIVMGGGNIFRGIQQGPKLKMPRTPADQIGMLATLINGITLQQALLQLDCPVRMMTALECPTVAEKYQWQKAMKHLEKGRIVLFVGGTGHPYFTTDTCAALRGCEIEAEILLKATTRVDGIYNKDPLVHKDAIKYETLSYSEVIEQKLGIIDLAAITLCMNKQLPIRVFNLFSGPLIDAVSETPLGTLVSGK